MNSKTLKIPSGACIEHTKRKKKKIKNSNRRKWRKEKKRELKWNFYYERNLLMLMPEMCTYCFDVFSPFLHLHTHTHTFRHHQFLRSSPCFFFSFTLCKFPISAMYEQYDSRKIFHSEKKNEREIGINASVHSLHTHLPVHPLTK